MEAHGRAIAVEYDFMQPFIAVWRAVDQRCRFGRDGGGSMAAATYLSAAAFRGQQCSMAFMSQPGKIE
jgi:hypothetical protein